MLNKRFFFSAAAGTALVLGLAGCGGSDGDTGIAAANPGTGAGAGNGTATPGNPEQPATNVSFVDRVLAIIGATSDTTEPQAIESVTVSTPDNTQPQPVS